MPYFDVSFNNENTLHAGGSDLTLIEVTLITSSSTGMPQLHVHGMRKKKNNNEYLEWLNREIAYNEIIKVRFYDTSEAFATNSPIKERMEKLTIENFLDHKKKKCLAASIKPVAESQLAQVGHEIVFDDSRRFFATVSGEATTQLRAIWHSSYSECKVELANLSESVSDHESEMWMETYLAANHGFEVKVMEMER